MRAMYFVLQLFVSFLFVVNSIIAKSLSLDDPVLVSVESRDSKVADFQKVVSCEMIEEGSYIASFSVSVPSVDNRSDDPGTGERVYFLRWEDCVITLNNEEQLSPCEDSFFEIDRAKVLVAVRPYEEKTICKDGRIVKLLHAYDLAGERQVVIRVPVNKCGECNELYDADKSHEQSKKSSDTKVTAESSDEKVAIWLSTKTIGSNGESTNKNSFARGGAGGGAGGGGGGKDPNKPVSLPKQCEVDEFSEEVLKTKKIDELCKLARKLENVDQLRMVTKALKFKCENASRASKISRKKMIDVKGFLSSKGLVKGEVLININAAINAAQ